MVAYQLMRYGWSISINYGKFSTGLHEVQGYDIFARKAGIERRIEVKLRDSFNGSKPTRVTVTFAEYKQLTHLIIVLLDESTHETYIIPKSALRRLKKRRKTEYSVYLWKIKGYAVGYANEWKRRLEGI